MVGQTTEMIPASANCQEPVAWAILHKDHQYVSLLREDAEAHNVYADAAVVPLFAMPQAEALQAEVADLRGKVVQLRRVIGMMQDRQFAVASAVREMTAMQAPPMESWECDDVI